MTGAIVKYLTLNPGAIPEKVDFNYKFGFGSGKKT
jgi:hypothetical protein